MEFELYNILKTELFFFISVKKSFGYFDDISWQYIFRLGFVPLTGRTK